MDDSDTAEHEAQGFKNTLGLLLFDAFNVGDDCRKLQSDGSWREVTIKAGFVEVIVHAGYLDGGLFNTASGPLYVIGGALLRGFPLLELWAMKGRNRCLKGDMQKCLLNDVGYWQSDKMPIVKWEICRPRLQLVVLFAHQVLSGA